MLLRDKVIISLSFTTNNIAINLDWSRVATYTVHTNIILLTMYRQICLVYLWMGTAIAMEVQMAPEPTLRPMETLSRGGPIPASHSGTT